MVIIKRLDPRLVKSVIIIFLIFSLGAAFGYAYLAKFPRPKPSSEVSQDSYQAFLSEIYDKTKENYWDNIADAPFLDLYKLALEKASGKPQLTAPPNKDSLLIMIREAMKGLNDEQKKQMVVNISASVLASLNPPGRSGLFTQKQEIALKNTVENINPEKDLYQDLGLAKGASEAAVAQAYQQKSRELSQDQSPQAQQKLKQLSYAKDVLTQKDTKSRYDQKGVEPTMFNKLIRPNIVYLQFNKFSPTSLEEFQNSLNLYQDKPVDGLIFDLRGNVGGTIDATAYFLGFFLGRNQYAFDFFHKGQYSPFKTPTERLAVISKFKQIVVLVDNQTQSSAEMLASALKKYHIGVIVGVPTKGWGTVERVFPLDNQIDKGEKYSLFLVHSITLRDDNQPIEGRGIEPNVNIKDANWEQQLFSYFRNPELTSAVKQLL